LLETFNHDPGGFVRMNHTRTRRPADRGYTVVAGYVPAALARALALLAAQNERSLSGEVRLALREHLAQQQHGERLST
jgi:hypothetical protein